MGGRESEGWEGGSEGGRECRRNRVRGGREGGRWNPSSMNNIEVEKCPCKNCSW